MTQSHAHCVGNSYGTDVASAVSGEVLISTAAAVNSGDMIMRTGNGTSIGGRSGSLEVSTGNTTGHAGDVKVLAGNGLVGGRLELKGGDGPLRGGSIYLQAGTTTRGSAGGVRVATGGSLGVNGTSSFCFYRIPRGH